MALKTEDETGATVSPAHSMNCQGPQGLQSLPPHMDVPVDTAGPYCQRNLDSTSFDLSYVVQILDFVRFTDAINSC